MWHRLVKGQKNDDNDAEAIGTGEAFDRGRDFAAWIELVSRQHSTGGKPILGRMSKRAANIRALFIQAACILLMRPQSWK